MIHNGVTLPTSQVFDIKREDYYIRSVESGTTAKEKMHRKKNDH